MYKKNVDIVMIGVCNRGEDRQTMGVEEKYKISYRLFFIFFDILLL